VNNNDRHISKILTWLQLALYFEPICIACEGDKKVGGPKAAAIAGESTICLDAHLFEPRKDEGR
jgi:hypothetical protein